MSRLVVIEEDALRALIRDEVGKALASHAPASPSACDWIDATEAARILGCARDYVRRVRGLPRHGSRRAPRYARTEVEAFVRARNGRPLSEVSSRGR